ncbi:hypothetical protein PISMIDRAFT_572520 [Pisolithus microcarpus 441]|uniref:Uncharacterized protein n=1 Tax=Pisolithus microcarpus 441 TaxID=765257 RepID=A0A0C9ZE69_9AGAM|nr:hypothetical protein PISMIDRAFT_572520 [Pisolithus microcarpus 441]
MRTEDHQIACIPPRAADKAQSAQCVMLMEWVLCHPHHPQLRWHQRSQPRIPLAPAASPRLG